MITYVCEVVMGYIISKVKLLLLLLTIVSWTVSSQVDWSTKEEILRRIIPPTFPSRTFDVTQYGAVGNGKKDCSKAFAKAIDACSKAGGGTVLVPAGKYLTGPIVLKSNVNLHVAKDAEILFFTDPDKYLPVVFSRWEGVECMNYSPLIYAMEQENIAITGEGVLNGQASFENWWSWKGPWKYVKEVKGPTQREARAKLFQMAEDGVPVEKRIFGKGSYLRPNFFMPYKCKNVLVEGVTFKDSPMWFLNPVLCTNVSFINVKTIGLGPNNDGIDPESCKDVLIRGCYFDNGDDCIAIKSGRNADGRRINVPCENIIVENCIMKNGHGGVSIGSELSGGVRNVFIENNLMDSPNLDRALRIKTNAMRGGVVENVFMRNCKVGQVAESAIKIDFYYEEGERGNFTPIVRSVFIDSIECQKVPYAIWIKAFKHSPATNVRITNCTFNDVANANVIENVKNFDLINVVVNNRHTSEKSK
ncbi:MAG: glycoside hydrolase family 28 protein [Bacteroidetes bacterium]|nr:glycoside hydrolase family 28 protein [Bacteroidota bacterium]